MTPQTQIRTQNHYKKVQIETPVFIKPNKMGSSMFASIAKNEGEIETRYRKIIDQHDDAIIAEYIQGSEISAIISDIAGEVNILSTVEITTDNKFYTKENKELGEGVNYKTATLPKTIERAIVSIYEQLGLKDVVRFDFIYKDNIYYFLEINTIPGMSMHSTLHNGLLFTKYKGLEKFILQLVEKNIGS